MEWLDPLFISFGWVTRKSCQHHLNIIGNFSSLSCWLLGSPATTGVMLDSSSLPFQIKLFLAAHPRLLPFGFRNCTLNHCELAHELYIHYSSHYCQTVLLLFQRPPVWKFVWMQSLDVSCGWQEDWKVLISSWAIYITTVFLLVALGNYLLRNTIYLLLAMVQRVACMSSYRMSLVLEV